MEAEKNATNQNSGIGGDGAAPSAEISFSGRQRKAAEKYGEFLSDISVQDLRAYNRKENRIKPKSNASKETVPAKPLNPMDLVATAYGSCSASSKSRARRGANVYIGTNQVVKPMNAEEKQQDEIEEAVIARSLELELRQPKPKAPLPEGTHPTSDLQAAIRKGVKDSSTILIDWTSQGAKFIGCTVKVYWDGDNVWYYGRIVNFDSFHKKHYVYYSDNTSEWIDVLNEAVIVGKEIVLSMRQHKWPAMHFSFNEFSLNALKKQRSFVKNSEYIEYFAEDGFLREHAFVPLDSLVPVSEQHLLPGKKSKKLEGSLASAVSEQVLIDSVVDTLLSLVRRSATQNLCGDEWIGLRVRAFTTPYYPTAVPSKSSNARGANRGNASIKAVGTVAQYCPSLNEHLIIFDQSDLRPQWVLCSSDTVETIISLQSAAQEHSAVFLQSQLSNEEKTANGMCMMCGGAHDCAGEPPAQEIAVTNNDSASAATGSKEEQSSLTGRLAPSAQPSLPKSKSKRSADNVDKLAENSEEVEAQKNRLEDLKDKRGFKTCNVCFGVVHNYCMPMEKIGLMDDPDNFICWLCLVCEGGCGSNTWQKPQHVWRLRRIDENAPDKTMGLCGDCIFRFKHKKEFCPVCYLLYAPDDSSGADEVDDLLPIEVGTRVNANFRNKGQWFPGKVSKINEDNTFGIEYDDGDKEARAPRARINVIVTKELVLPPDVNAVEVASSEKITTVDSAPTDTAVGSAESLEEPSNAEEMVVENSPSSQDQAISTEVDAPNDGAPQSPNQLIQMNDADSMVQCNECARWVHSACEGIDQAQYEAMTKGTHPVWGDEYLCPVCRVLISQKVVDALSDADETDIFGRPVDVAIAKTYYEVIRTPMDLSTMMNKAARGQYKSLQSLRVDFELMCLNAMLFNKPNDEYWKESKIFYAKGQIIFERLPRHTQLSAFGAELVDILSKQYTEEKRLYDELQKAKSRNALVNVYAYPTGTNRPTGRSTALTTGVEVEESHKRRRDDDIYICEEVKQPPKRADGLEDTTKVTPSSSPSKSELGSPVAELAIVLPMELTPPTDVQSYYNNTLVLQSGEDAFYLCCLDHCMVCTSAGSPELLLCCFDCGEAVHSFCADIPLATMPTAQRQLWRCTNCKICEVCGTATEEEAHTLVYCEACDQSYHFRCLSPPIEGEAPDKWFCASCVDCKLTSCSKKAGWGFSKDKCCGCIFKERDSYRAEISMMDAEDQLLQKVAYYEDREELLRAATCSVCKDDASDCYLRCSRCRAPCHPHCLQSLESWPILNNNSAYSDFRCDQCLALISSIDAMETDRMSSPTKSTRGSRSTPAPFQGPLSHVGSGPDAVALLTQVAEIQRTRANLRGQKRKAIIAAEDEHFNNYYERHRQVLIVIIKLAVHRIQFLEDGSFSAKFLDRLTNKAEDETVRLNSNMFLRSRATRFMAFWRHVDIGGVPEMKARQKCLAIGLNIGGADFDAIVLARIACLAAAFLSYTSIEIAESELEAHVQDLEKNVTNSMVKLIYEYFPEAKKEMKTSSEALHVKNVEDAGGLGKKEKGLPVQITMGKLLTGQFYHKCCLAPIGLTDANPPESFKPSLYPQARKGQSTRGPVLHSREQDLEEPMMHWIPGGRLRMPLTGRAKRAKILPQAPEAYLLWKCESSDRIEMSQNEALLRSLLPDHLPQDRNKKFPTALGAGLIPALGSAQSSSGTVTNNGRAENLAIDFGLHPPLPPGLPGPLSNILAESKIAEYRSVCPTAGPSILATKYRIHQDRYITPDADLAFFNTLLPIETPAIKKLQTDLAAFDADIMNKGLLQKQHRMLSEKREIVPSKKVASNPAAAIVPRRDSGASRYISGNASLLAAEAEMTRRVKYFETFKANNFGFKPNENLKYLTDEQRMMLIKNHIHKEEPEKVFCEYYYRRTIWFKEDYLMRDLVRTIYPSFGLRILSLGETLYVYYQCYTDQIMKKAYTFVATPSSYHPHTAGMGAFTASCCRFLWYAFAQVVDETLKQGILRVARYTKYFGMTYWDDKDIGEASAEEEAGWKQQLERDLKRFEDTNSVRPYEDEPTGLIEPNEAGAKLASVHGEDMDVSVLAADDPAADDPAPRAPAVVEGGIKKERVADDYNEMKMVDLTTETDARVPSLIPTAVVNTDEDDTKMNVVANDEATSTVSSSAVTVQVEASLVPSDEKVPKKKKVKEPIETLTVATIQSILGKKKLARDKKVLSRLARVYEAHPWDENPQPRYKDGSRKSLTILGKSPIRSSGISPLRGWGDGLTSLLGPELPWEDPRVCGFCLSWQEDNITGGFLSFPDGGVAHANCLRWSAEVVERNNVLQKAISARRRIHSAPACGMCGKKGATVGCLHKACRRSFHLRCAYMSHCALLEAEYCGPFGISKSAFRPNATPGGDYEIHTLMVCPEHIVGIDQRRLYRKWIPQPPTRLLLMELDSEISFESLSSKLYGGNKRGGQSFSARQGALTVLTLGLPRIDLSGFHSKKYIFPHHFSSARIFWSMRHPLKRTLYIFEILTESDFDGTEINVGEIGSTVEDLLVSDATSTGTDSPKKERSGHLLAAAFSPSSPSGSHKTFMQLSAHPVFRVVVMDCFNASSSTESNVHRQGGVSQWFNADHGVLPGVRPSGIILTRDIDQAYEIILRGVKACRAKVPRLTPRKEHATYGLNAPQFFGIALPAVRRALEQLPESTAAVIALPPAPQYAPSYRLPTIEDVMRTQQAQVSAKVPHRPSVNGCARADGVDVQTKPASGTRVTRILAKDVDRDKKTTEEEEKAAAEKEENRREIEKNRNLYYEHSSAYLRDPNARLEVRKSHIHNWGLFTRTVFDKDDMIVEYIGEKIRQVVADRREVKYEEEGVGSCYLFRLDKDDIVDATRTGGMARFMNHCCEPNAYAKIIQCDDAGLDKHIVIMAARDIQEGEEVTYDYKFPLEDKKLRCYCGASRCKGSMN